MIDLFALLILVVILAGLIHGVASVLPLPQRLRSRRLRLVLVWLIAVPMSLMLIWSLSKSRSYQLVGELVTRVEGTPHMVALSFDDGPSAHGGEAILAMLDSLQVPATFFFTGHELEARPDMGQRFVAAGHELGNHGWTHRSMVFRSQAWIADEIERTDALIRAAGQSGPILFRPPYFRRLLALPWYLASGPGRAVILADVEPESIAGVGGDSDAIVAHVLERVQPGSIILLHVMYPSRHASLQAVPGIVEGLRARGYELVTVSALIAAGAGAASSSR